MNSLDEKQIADKLNEIISGVFSKQHEAQWWLKSSVKHWTETGTISGSFREAVARVAKEFVKEILTDIK